MSEENWDDDGPTTMYPPVTNVFESQGSYSQNNERRNYSGGNRSNYNNSNGRNDREFRNSNRSNPNRSNFGNSGRSNDNRDDWGSKNSNRSNFNSGPSYDGDETIIKVPSKFVGRIIGRGGCKINEIQDTSGARVQIDKNASDGDETVVKLSGGKHAVGKAREMIEELTSDRERPQRETGGWQERPQREAGGWQERPQRESNNWQQQQEIETDDWGQPINQPQPATQSQPITQSQPSTWGQEKAQPESNSWNQEWPEPGSNARRQERPQRRQNAWGQNKYVPEERSEPAEPAGPIDWQKLYRECDAKDEEEWSKYKPVIKEFYSEHPDVTNLTDEEVAQFRESSNNVVVDRTFKKEDSKPIPKPVITFEHAFHNYPEILEEIRKQGFEKPSPIQSQAWPVLLSGEDLIGIAQTGTGKTLAFLLPALIHIDGQGIDRDERGGPAVLVMAPTRELALQIDKEVKKYQYKGITSICIYGGANRREQVKHLDGGVDIVIATPGRLNDLSSAGHLNVKTVTYVVLDEADRMLDMGFEPQIRKVMYAIRPTRQTVMTSATWPPGVRSLANSYMKDPIQIYVGTLDLAATHTVTQTIQIVEDSDEEKMKVFFDFVHNLGPSDKVIVFCGKKSRADDLASDLAMSGVSCQTMHGDRDQIDREQALADIADGTVQILIATDLASRGLDIEDITHVVNYDFPRNIEEYVHRVGRTGRAGRLGESISYVTRADWSQAKDLIKILEEAQQFVPEEIYKMAERFEAKKENDDKFGGRKRFGGGNRGGRKW